MTLHFETEDRGKPVVTAAGDVIGVVNGIRDGEALVAPRPDPLAGFGSWLESGGLGDGPYPLVRHHVDSVRDDEIRLKVGSNPPELLGER